MPSQPALTQLLLLLLWRLTVQTQPLLGLTYLLQGEGKRKGREGEEEGERGGRRRDSTDSHVNPSKAVTIALLEGRRKGKRGPFMCPEWDKMMM